MPADVRAVWRSPRFDRVGAAAYDFFVERERLARVGGLLMWGADTRLLYRSLDAIGAMPDGSAILDVPCGGGLAFRALRPDQRVRYVAADISPGMLRRARRVADERGLGQIELMEADVEDLPFDDASFDLCVCFNSLHCFPDPARGLEEIARCLRPGGRLIGDAAVRGRGARYDFVIEQYARRGIFGPGGSAADLERWLADAGLEQIRLTLSGAVAYFDAAAPRLGRTSLSTAYRG
jgi:ubiquinone/menaquinone biosynthesis C-methylase UbiE